MTTYTDNFNRANGAISVGNAAWVALSGYTIPSIVTNAVNMNATVGAYYNQTFTDDQYVQIVPVGMQQLFAARTMWMFIRGNASDKACYSMALNSNDNGDTGWDIGITLYRLASNGAATQIGATYSEADVGINGTFRLAVTGSTINGYRDGVLVTTATDTNIAGGKPGFYGLTGNTGVTVDNFEAADTGAPPATNTKTQILIRQGTTGNRALMTFRQRSSAVSSGALGVSAIMTGTATGATAYITGVNVPFSGSRLLLYVGSTSTGTVSISDTQGMTWSFINGRTNGGMVSAWSAVAPAALTNISITGTTAGNAFDQYLALHVITGSTSIGTSANEAGSSTPIALAITPQAAGTLLFAMANEWAGSVLPTPISGQTVLSQWDAPIGIWWSLRLNGSTPNTSPVTLGTTSPSAVNWTAVAVEVK